MFHVEDWINWPYQFYLYKNSALLLLKWDFFLIYILFLVYTSNKLHSFKPVLGHFATYSLSDIIIAFNLLFLTFVPIRFPLKSTWVFKRPKVVFRFLTKQSELNSPLWFWQCQNRNWIFQQESNFIYWTCSELRNSLLYTYQNTFDFQLLLFKAIHCH